MNRPLSAAVWVLTIAGIAIPAHGGTIDGTGWNDTARLLAGMENSVASRFDADQKATWDSHAAQVDRDWGRLRRQYLDHLENWARAEVKDTAAGATAFYPFSGPDVATLATVYPEAREYVMVGLEPPGTVPQSLAGYTPDYLATVRHSLRSAVLLGFFKTNEMKQDFRMDTSGGLLPVLLLFLARSGYTVTSVDNVALAAPDGQAAGVVHGVAILFNDARQRARKLTYLQVDLSNSILEKPAALKFLNDLRDTRTLVKSASYLMHKQAFSTIRHIILARSEVIVEEDSGIPFKFFTPGDWQVGLYGTYKTPIPLFRRCQQDDLAEAYATRQGIQPLPFGIGYQFRPGTSNLLVARREKGSGEKPGSTQSNGIF